jgi:hypothetical protein
MLRLFLFLARRSREVERALSLHAYFVADRDRLRAGQGSVGQLESHLEETWS